MDLVLMALTFFFAGIGAEVVGFGISAVSMAFLPLFLPIHIAVPLVAIISVVATGIVAYRTKEKDLTEILIPLFVGSAIGIPVGMYALDFLPERTLMVILGIILISSSVYSLLGKDIKIKVNSLTGILVGFLTGVFGASVNVNGPVVGMYLATDSNISKTKNKDLITTYMFFTGLFVIVGHYIAGRIDREIGLYTLISLPTLFLGLQIGKHIFNRISAKTLSIVIYVIVLIAGIRLLF